MKPLRSLAPLLALALAFPASARKARAQDGTLRPLQAGQEKIAREAGAAVVGLARPRQNARSVSEALDSQAGGAGFVVDADGSIITDASLVPARGEVTVTFRGGHRARARVVATDPHTRVALLRLVDPADVAARLGGKLPVLPLGQSSDLKLGRLVGTLGNPFDSLETDGVPAFSLGVVSGLGRLRDADSFKGYVIETDAAVNPGSFGGPLVDVQGRAVGVVLEAYSPKRWFGVAVPIDEVARVLDDLKAGHAPRGPRLGVSVAGAGEADAQGLALADVAKDSPAARAGVHAGDRLRSIDGTRVAEPFDIERELGQLAQGAPVDLELERDGKTLTVTAVLDAAAAEVIATGLPQKNEIPLQTPAPDKNATKTQGGWAGLNVQDGDAGVTISQVVAGGPAEKAGLKVGDKVVSANGAAIKTRDDLIQAIKGHAAGDKIALRIEREGWGRDVELVLGTKSEGTPAPEREGPEERERPRRRERDREGPTAKRGFLGVAVQPQDDEDAKGVKVVRVVDDSAAAKAKIQEGDTILAIDGAPVDGPEAFTKSLQSRKPGESVQLLVDRGGWQREFKVVLGERPAELDRPQREDRDDDDDERGERGERGERERPEEPRSREKSEAPRPWLGIAVVEQGGHLVVDEVAKDSPAATAKLQKGDVVAFERDGKRWEPKTADELGAYLADKKPGDTLKLFVERDGWSKSVTLTLGEHTGDHD